MPNGDCTRPLRARRWRIRCRGNGKGIGSGGSLSNGHCPRTSQLFDSLRSLCAVCLSRFGAGFTIAASTINSGGISISGNSRCMPIWLIATTVPGFNWSGLGPKFPGAKPKVILSIQRPSWILELLIINSTNSLCVRANCVGSAMSYPVRRSGFAAGIGVRVTGEICITKPPIVWVVMLPANPAMPWSVW